MAPKGRVAMPRTTREPSPEPGEDLVDPASPQPGHPWIKAHSGAIGLAILAGGLGGVVLYLLAQAL